MDLWTCGIGLEPQLQVMCLQRIEPGYASCCTAGTMMHFVDFLIEKTCFTSVANHDNDDYSYTTRNNSRRSRWRCRLLRFAHFFIPGRSLPANKLNLSTSASTEQNTETPDPNTEHGIEQTAYVMRPGAKGKALYSGMPHAFGALNDHINRTVSSRNGINCRFPLSIFTKVVTDPTQRNQGRGVFNEQLIYF